jgi:carbamate kinase
MTHRKIVVALGGDAILMSNPSAKAQKAALVQTAKHLVKLIKNGDDLIITHGKMVRKLVKGMNCWLFFVI